MRIGVVAIPQHSMFSSGGANTSLAIAELFEGLGHEVSLVSLNGQTWWDDCEAAKRPVVSVKDASGLDLVIEIDRMMLPKEHRAKIARHCVWLIRHPFIK